MVEFLTPAQNDRATTNAKIPLRQQSMTTRAHFNACVLQFSLCTCDSDQLLMGVGASVVGGLTSHEPRLSRSEGELTPAGIILHDELREGRGPQGRVPRREARVHAQAPTESLGDWGGGRSHRGVSTGSDQRLPVVF